MSDSVAGQRKPAGRGNRRGRKPTSCTQCHLRKQKCDRKQPCNRCLHRGVAHLCGDSTANGVAKTSEIPQTVAKSTVDRLVDIFLAEVNWSLDAVHEATFRGSYDEFWGRRFGFDDLANVDLRWLGLLFIILAFGVLLDTPPRLTLDVQREREEASLRFYWAARRVIVIAPSFYGESTDIVRAGLLVTRYLLHTRRVSESWLTIGFASRMGQSQGMHMANVAKGPDIAGDEALPPYLAWHRLYLHTSFHFARIILHRSFLLRESITDRSRPSHEACMSSALADLKIRLRTMNSSTADNLRWAFGAHNLFNSAMILGIIAVKAPHSAQAGAILEDLEAYCENLHRDPWLNEFGMAELKVIELCIAKARDARSTLTSVYASGSPAEPPGSRAHFADGRGRLRPPDLESPAMSSDMSSIYWPTVWEDGQFSFPGAADFRTWEQMISDIAEESYIGQ
ncbi:hypothetical protein J3F83DRAFT_713925 [Trichoderma novae-zelandiae]